MKEFALLFRMNITSPERQPTSQQMKEYMEHWTAWVQGISEKGSVIGGTHFSKDGWVLKSGGDVSQGPYVDAEKQSVAGYIIVSCNDVETALDIARQCPILNGSETSVEIRETASPG